MKSITRLFNKTKQLAGFTMIELLIVITILGILAVAVLSVINPIEQINRGRDTGSRSDAEQLVSAIDRFYAFQGYYPWQTSPSVGDAQAWQEVTLDDTADGWTNGTAGCGVLEVLGTGDGMGTTDIGAGDTCEGSQEVKSTFLSRITESSYNTLYVYNEGTAGSSTYVCFIPQSGAFTTEATDRCGLDTLPSDFPPNACDTDVDGDGTNDYLICLP